MSSSELISYLRQFWRVPLIGLLAGALAFGGSFVVEPTYESTTQLLVRGRDATFLTTTGEGLRDQPGVIDATLAQALGETQSALLASRAVAQRVVEELGLHEARPVDQSLVARTRRAFRNVYARVKSYIVYGFYAQPPPYDRAVEEVYEGLSARPLKDSYVVELSAAAGSPGLAAAIADSGADALVEVSRQRFREDAARHRDFLSGQVERAAAEERVAAQAVRDFKDQHDVSDVGLQIELTTRAEEELRLDLQSTEVSLAATRAELDTLRASLRAINSTEASSSRIDTGRSTTRIDATSANSAYQQLLVQRELAEAQVASLEARQEALRDVLGLSAGSTLTDEEARLRQLELQYAVASDAFRDLSARYQQAVINAENDLVEITRVDRANVPIFPAGPKRWLYLGMGGIVGGLAGLVLTYLAVMRRGGSLLPGIGPGRTPVGRFEMFSPGEPGGSEA